MRAGPEDAGDSGSGRIRPPMLMATVTPTCANWGVPPDAYTDSVAIRAGRGARVPWGYVPKLPRQTEWQGGCPHPKEHGRDRPRPTVTPPGLRLPGLDVNACVTEGGSESPTCCWPGRPVPVPAKLEPRRHAGHRMRGTEAAEGEVPGARGDGGAPGCQEPQEHEPHPGTGRCRSSSS